MRLLVIEDERDLCEDIAKKLRLSGYEADTCFDGEAALELLAVEKYDLVLLDLNLPKVDGMTVLRTLREHDQETGVLILSARSEISDKVDGLDAGANDYLSKPFHLEELEARVRSLTRRRHYARPVAWFFFLSFISSHLVYIWADANFYRPITMQRANLPLSYPMTARRFLEKHGLLDAQDYQRRLVEQGAPEAVSVQYPLSNLRYRDLGAGYNVLLITVDNLNYSRFEKTMPALAAFAKENVNFTQHMSSGNTADSGLFGLFYGISPG